MPVIASFAARHAAPIRCLMLVMALLLLAASLFAGQNAIDNTLRAVCPEGWWHVGAGGLWAHCAFPAISIAKYAGIYTAFCIAALFLTYIAVPKAKLMACYALLFIFMSGPMIYLAAHGFSWTACAALCGVSMFALVFSLGAQAMRQPALERLASATSGST